MKKPSKDHKVVLREHKFDGIQEFDQKLPNWWLFTFYIMIALFICYWFAYYQLPIGLKTNEQKINSAIAKIELKKETQLAEMLASVSDKSLFEMSKETSMVEQGHTIYNAKCAACHGQNLNGMMGELKLPGVNLVDVEWKYGSKPLDIMKLITEGSPDITKGMIAWKSQLNPSDIAKVVAFILSEQPDTYKSDTFE